MQITVKVSYDVAYTIEYFEPAEGGQDHDTFGDTVQTLEEAIHLLELARSYSPNHYWAITCDVQTKIKEEK